MPCDQGAMFSKRHLLPDLLTMIADFEAVLFGAAFFSATFFSATFLTAIFTVLAGGRAGEFRAFGAVLLVTRVLDTGSGDAGLRGVTAGLTTDNAAAGG